MSATINSHRVTEAVINIPSWGCWFAEVSVDGEHVISGAATISVGGLTLVGTVLSGGPALGRSRYRVVAGRGGWGLTIPKKSYANDAGVRVSTVLSDAASACGESIVASTPAVTGPAYVRQEGPASRSLSLLSPQSWYVDNDGVTRLGAREGTDIKVPFTRIEPVDQARKSVAIATETIATILPGVIVDGLTAVDVQHSIGPDGLRSRIWGSVGNGSRRTAGLAQLLAQLDPHRQFRGVTEYRVVTQSGERLNLQPVRVSTGMPDLARVPVRPGVAGMRATVALGSRVLVAFIDSDPGMPVVVSHEDADGEGFEPSVLNVNGGAEFVALATKTNARFSQLQSAFDAHVHPTALGPSSPPTTPIVSFSSVASSVLKSD